MGETPMPRNFRPTDLEELQKIIGEQFPGANVVGITEKNHGVFGPFVWAGFKNKDLDERHRLVTEKIRDRLGMRGINIGVLHALAPGEKL